MKHPKAVKAAKAFFEKKKPSQSMPKGDTKANAGTKMKPMLGVTQKKTEPDNPIMKPLKPRASGLAKKRLEGVKI